MVIEFMMGTRDCFPFSAAVVSSLGFCSADTGRSFPGVKVAGPCSDYSPLSPMLEMHGA